MLFSKVTNTLACFGSAVLFISSHKLQARELIACHDCHMKRLPKAKELPIYDTKDNFTIEYDEKSSLPLVSEISLVRKQVSQYVSYINTFQEQAVHIYETGAAHSKSTFDYLKDEENKIQRIMIVASGGLVGLLYARRGGIFRKIFYTSLGTGALFSVFYPGISKEYILTGWNTAKHQFNNVLVNYGGFDTDKWAEETNAKFEKVKSAMKFEGLTNKLKEVFYKGKEYVFKESKVENDKSSKDSMKDQDMYTTRTSN